MRLNEIFMPDRATEVEEILYSRGWETVGSGLYANVYSKPGLTYVLKVYEGDSGYDAFLNLINTHPNPHFPKTIGKVRISPRYKAIRMERLKPIAKVSVDEYHVNVSGMLNAYLINKRNKLNDVQERNLQFAHIYLADKPQLVVALDLINNKLLDRYRLDISNYNIMMRDDGTVVITDPIYA